jgi:hypothetical protein
MYTVLCRGQGVETLLSERRGGAKHGVLLVVWRANPRCDAWFARGLPAFYSARQSTLQSQSQCWSQPCPIASTQTDTCSSNDGNAGHHAGQFLVGCHAECCEIIGHLRSCHGAGTCGGYSVVVILADTACRRSWGPCPRPKLLGLVGVQEARLSARGRTLEARDRTLEARDRTLEARRRTLEATHRGSPRY